MTKYLLHYYSKKDLTDIGILFVCGTLSHFLYGWYPCALFALLCPVNESTWEHLKLLYFPYLFLTILRWVQMHSHSRKQLLHFFYYRYLSVAAGMAATILLFYTYTGVIGRHFLVIDILIFFISIAISYALPHLYSKRDIPVPSANVVFSCWIITTGCFFAFTCYPPDIGLFILT